MRVRSRDERDAALEQAVQKSAQDHRIADVAHEELVEAEQARFGGDTGGDRVQRILNLAERLQSIVHALHHAVEMNAALVLDRHGLEEKIHQECLAAADAAPDVQAGNRRHAIVPVSEQAQERPTAARRFELPLQVSQQIHDSLLCRVANMAVSQ